jgi:CMP/dCMP kinase
MKVTIFWFAWSGTSTVWKLLAQKMNYQFMSSGNIMRSWWEELGLSIYDFEDKVIKKDFNFDLKLDKKVAIFWRENTDFILESRLAWYFIPDSFKVFLKCEQAERYRRIQEREKKPYSEIADVNAKRESELVTRYKGVYPDIIFPPQEDSFDIVIDATSILPEQVVDIILKKIQ